MLLHLVCFKYKADVDAATRASTASGSRALRSLTGWST